MIQTKAFVLGTNPAVAFIAHPLEKGRWLKTDPAAVFVQCPYCNSPAGMPCTSRSSTSRNYTASTHTVRRDAFQLRKHKIVQSTVPSFVVEPMAAQALQAMMYDDGK